MEINGAQVSGDVTRDASPVKSRERKAYRCVKGWKLYKKLVMGL
jgi:hypothetical protein